MIDVEILLSETLSEAMGEYLKRETRIRFFNNGEGERYKGLCFLSNLGIKMGGIKVYISDDLERRFREAAMRLYGYGEGSLSIACEKAFAA